MEINSKVTMSLHPDMVQSIKGYNELTAVYTESARNTLAATYKAITEIYKTAEAIKSDPLLNDDHKVLKISQHTFKRQQAALKGYDATLADLNRFIDSTERSLSAPLTQNAGAGIINEEIRRHVSNLSSDEKTEFLQNALKSNDKLTLTAVLGAPHYLTGLSPESHSHFTSTFHQKRDPELMEKLKMSKGSRDLLMKNANLVQKEFEKAMGSDWARANAIKAAVDNASNALLEAIA